MSEEEKTEETPATQPENLKRPDKYIISPGPDISPDTEAFFQTLSDLANKHAVTIAMPIHGELEVEGPNANVIAFFEEANPLFQKAVSVIVR